MSIGEYKRLSHEARAQRNKEILALHKQGVSTDVICFNLGVSYAILGDVLRSLGVSRHAIASENRKRAAALVGAKGDVKAVAIQFRRGVGWVEDACREHGVSFSGYANGRTVPKKLLLVIADLQNNPEATYQAVADAYKITRQRVHQILVEAIDCGFLFPCRRVPTTKTQPAVTVERSK